MDTDITTPFIEAKDTYVAWLTEQDHPTYEVLLTKALELAVGDDPPWRGPDPTRIHKIDDGDYQGTLVFVIGATGYQPFDYWYTRVYYGSCSGCDALEDAWGYGEQRDYEGLWTIALHMLQGMRKMYEAPVGE